MTKVFEQQRFECFYDRPFSFLGLPRPSGRIFEDMEFRRCHFESSAISITKDPRRRTTVRNVRLIQCEEVGCSVWGAIVEEVIVDGLRTGGLLHTWGAVFKHVVLKGKIGGVMLSPLIDPSSATPAEQRVFDEANAAYYATVDWALDIREAEFEEVDLRSVPGRLIRRDPATQVLVTRERAADGRWRNLGLGLQTYWPTAIEFFLEDSKEEAIVLAAPKRNREFRQLLWGLQVLREAGIAEPD